MGALAELSPLVGTMAACEALNLSRASVYRHRLPRISTAKPRRKVPRALVASERQSALAYLHEARFQNCSPAAICATLLDEGTYPCSIRTMYRLLAAEGNRGNAGINSPTRPTPSTNCWPLRLTSSGVGTLPN